MGRMGPMVCLDPLGQKGSLEKLGTVGNRVLLALQGGKDHVSVSVSMCICTDAGITISHFRICPCTCREARISLVHLSLSYLQGGRVHARRFFHE